MGLSQQECWSELPFPPPGDLSNPGIEPQSPAIPAVSGGFFTTEPPGKMGYSASVQFTQSCLTLCDSMNRSTPGPPCPSPIPEFTQTHVHQVGDAIQPSHPLLSPSPPAPIPPSIRVFSNESTVYMAKVLEFQLQHQSFQ